MGNSIVRLALATFGVFSGLLVTGCASIVSESEYPVTITSVPDEVAFLLYGPDGQLVRSGKTPELVMLDTDGGYFSGADYRIDFMYQGRVIATRAIESDMDGWYWGNLLFGGIIGFFIVDPLTGAMWEFPSSWAADVRGEMPSNGSTTE